eukprot:5382791-Pyramimonas_sp.AAC.1
MTIGEGRFIQRTASQLKKAALQKLWAESSNVDPEEARRAERLLATHQVSPFPSALIRNN